MRSIVLFLPNWVGDVVMATPAIRAVREHLSAARLLAVCRPYVADTLAGSPWFDDAILARRSLEVVARLRSAQANVAVLFPNSFRSALVARLGGCRTVVGFARYLRDALEALDAQQAFLEVTGPASPGLIRPASGPNGYIQVIMPMHVAR